MCIFYKVCIVSRQTIRVHLSKCICTKYFQSEKKWLSILLFHLIWMRIVEMLLQFMLGIILSTNHADSTKKIQMLGWKVNLLMINFEMKLQIIFFLSMAKKSTQVTLDTQQWPMEKKILSGSVEKTWNWISTK